MTLKLKDEMLHSLIINRTNLEILGKKLKASLMFKGSNSNVLNKAQVKHVHNSLNAVKYEFDNSVDVVNNLYAISPVCVPIVHVGTTDAGEYFYTDNKKILNDESLNVSSLQKEINDKGSLFNNQELLNWLRFLNKQNITGNLSYILAFKNIQTAYKLSDINNEVSWPEKVYLISKHQELNEIGKLIRFCSHRSMVEYRLHKHNVTLKSVLQTNKKLGKVVNSSQPFYLNISEDQAHKDISDVILGMRRHLLMSKIKNAIPIVCPKCHIYTYDCFPYCQNCGAKLKPVIKSETKDN